MPDAAVDFLKTAMKAKGDNLVVSELLQEIMSVWGGPRNFAKDIMTEFQHAKEGGLIRAKFIDFIMRLFVSHTNINKPMGDDLSAASDAELHAAAKDILGEA